MTTDHIPDATKKVPDALRLAAALDSDPSDITGHKSAAIKERLK